MENCSHPKLTEADNFTGQVVIVEGESLKGNVIGMLTWKKYICDECGKLITILNAVVENIEREGEQK